MDLSLSINAIKNIFSFPFRDPKLVLCIFAPLILFPGSFYMMLLVYRIIGQAYGEGAAKAGTLTAAPEAEIPPTETLASA